MLRSLTKFSKLILEERYGNQCEEFECGSWGLMGIKAWLRWPVSQIHVRSVTGEKDTTLSCQIDTFRDPLQNFIPKSLS